MKKAFAVSLSIISSVLLFALDAHPAEITLTNALTNVYFSPNGGCTEAIIKEIARAKTEILIQAYSFTPAPIAKALVDAHN